MHENPDAYSHRALAWLDRERQRDGIAVTVHLIISLSRGRPN
jgi:hypothetical protein